MSEIVNIFLYIITFSDMPYQTALKTYIKYSLVKINNIIIYYIKWNRKKDCKDF